MENEARFEQRIEANKITSQEETMFDSWRRRYRFEQSVKDVLAQLEREGVNRVDRSQVEEIGQRFGLNPYEVREALADSLGDVWKGKFIDSDEEPGWEALALEEVPSTCRSGRDLSHVQADTGLR